MNNQPKRPVRTRYQVAEALAKQGKTSKEIAEAMNTSSENVYQLLKSSERWRSAHAGWHASLTVRTANSLKMAGYYDIEKLAKDFRDGVIKQEIHSIKAIGLRGMKELVSFMRSCGYEVPDAPARKKAEKALDYKALLKKYMRHVNNCEGVTFVEYINTDDSATESDVQFDPLEVVALRNMHDEVTDE